MLSCNNCTYEVDSVNEWTQYCNTCQEAYLDGKNEIIPFLKNKIDDLQQKRDEYIKDNDYEMDDYLAGCIDAYDIVLMQLTPSH
jgi:tryptophanyl-tRNA synthetase